MIQGQFDVAELFFKTFMDHKRIVRPPRWQENQVFPVKMCLKMWIFEYFRILITEDESENFYKLWNTK